MLNGAAPAFALEGGLALALVRGLADVALISTLGSLAFRMLILPRAADAVFSRQLGRVVRVSAGAGAVLMPCWLALQTNAMAGSVSPASVADVLTGTLFGTLVALQCGLLALCALVKLRWALVPGSAALLLQAGHSHAYSMMSGSRLLLVSDLLHLGAAGAWLGGLLPLLLLIRVAPEHGAAAAMRFSPLGMVAVLVLAGTALCQGMVLIGSIPALIGTAYGWVALAKLLLFLALLACAGLNRLRFTPAASRGDATRLARSVLVEATLGLVIVLAAALLSSFEPGMHAEAIWPFTSRPSLDAVAADPAFRREVLGAVLALAGAALLLLVAIRTRRTRRWIALVASLVVMWLALPHLDLLFVDAYPTSYFRSPTGFGAASIVTGSRLFPTHCAACHGAEGRGDGPAAKGLPESPADLTAEHLWMHSDGELFWWLAHGMATPEGQPAMPGFGDTLSTNERWALIDAIRAHNAGLVAQRTGEWTPPVQAPGFTALCEGARDRDNADLRGEIFRVAIGDAPADIPDLRTMPDLLTIIATTDPAIRPGPHRCVIRDETVPLAYAIIAGIAPDHIAGTEFLVDAQGWLRAVHGSATTPAWDEHTIAAELRRIHDHPIKADNAQMDMPM